MSSYASPFFVYSASIDRPIPYFVEMCVCMCACVCFTVFDSATVVVHSCDLVHVCAKNCWPDSRKNMKHTRLGSAFGSSNDAIGAGPRGFRFNCRSMLATVQMRTADPLAKVYVGFALCREIQHSSFIVFISHSTVTCAQHHMNIDLSNQNKNATITRTTDKHSTTSPPHTHSANTSAQNALAKPTTQFTSHFYNNFPWSL